MACLLYAATFYENLQSSFCYGSNPGVYIYILLEVITNVNLSMNLILNFNAKFIFLIIDPSVWHQEHEECNKICTIRLQSLPCSDNDTRGIAVFQFDINLPVHMYTYGKCKSCFNITKINITCMLLTSEPHSIQNEEITTWKIITDPYSTDNEKIISKNSGKCFLSLSYLVNVFFVEKKNYNVYKIKI